MGIGKRMWDVARSNVSDFASAFSLDEEVRERRRFDSEVEKEVEREVADTLGAKAGRRARRVADKAQDAWDREFERARAAGGGGGGVRGRPPQSEVEGWYRTLEVPVGTDMAQVRKSYRRLLSKYHPDKYAGDPEKYAAATEVASKITTAYNGIKALHG